MTIEFRCPNGHRLSCPDERAGLKGRCPKCRAIFQVPMPNGQGPPEALMPPGAEGAAISDSGVSEPELAEQATTTDSAVAIEAADSAAAQELAADEQTAPLVSPERIVFLCPNGHRLNCPASMQGRPGKCPHCGAKFLVPELDADAEGNETFDDDAEQAAQEEPAAEPEPQTETAVEEDGDFNAGGYAGTLYEFDFASLTSDAGPASPEATGHHAMAGVFQRLWPHKRTGSIVELYLKGGEVIAPEWFAPRASHESYGMFAFAEQDGSFTMTAVNWDAIERIAVRHVSALPPGMFDEEQG